MRAGICALLQCICLQCVKLVNLCDREGDCNHDADEARCMDVKFPRPLSPPAILYFTPRRNFSVTTAYFMRPLVSSCPGTHFQCPDNGYCLPVFLRCNGVNDCPGREDETGCDRVSCAGLYRCRSSSVCLHPSHVCDDSYQCPQQDDERFCGLTCPAGCTCHGLEATCQKPFRDQLHSGVRYLDASGSGLNLSCLTGKTMLIHLNLSRCGLKSFHEMTFPNLLSLDLSYNELQTISVNHLRKLMNLRYLSLAGNSLKSLFSESSDQVSLPALKVLDLSGVRILKLNASIFSHFLGLHKLNLSRCGIDQMTDDGFHATNKLRVLDISGCPMTLFPRDLLSGLMELQTVEADNFKMCCPDTLPFAFNPSNCRAPVDEVSSCESLLRSNVYVVFLVVFSCLALLGNTGCFLTRSLCPKGSASGFGVFVTHLSISDFIMGVYLAIIGVADRLYKGTYIWHDIDWRHSSSCEAAGFLSFLSSEVSACIVCLITLDRFVVLRFPFSSQHFKERSAHMTCAMVWLFGIVIVSVPLTPFTSDWSFYSRTGICIPLPINRKDFTGRQYAFSVMIVFNFILFLLIAAGQAAIYVSIRVNSMSRMDSTKKSTDLRIARRLITVAVSDFLCWFPVGLLGLLASRGVPVPGEINVGLAILVLPLNSAINPFLYTIGVMLERQRRLRDAKLLKQLMKRICEEE